jgi:CheY-like chemotaxis protein
MNATATIQTKILIVEDELLAAENLARNLRKQGYEITSIVDSGEAAIANATENHPDLVLMDIMLQGDMDGIAAAKTIDNRLKIPVVYMTAYADETTLKKAQLTNPYGYLVKPFKPNEKATESTRATKKY